MIVYRACRFYLLVDQRIFPELSRNLSRSRLGGSVKTMKYWEFKRKKIFETKSSNQLWGRG
jgi:hypothetical protein